MISKSTFFLLPNSKRSWSVVAGVLLTLLMISSCGGEKKEASNPSSPPQQDAASPTAVAPSPPTAPERPKFPPLTERILSKIVSQSALIRASGQPDSLGVIIRGNNSTNGRYEYQVICHLPSAPDSILCATKHQNQMIVVNAKKLSELPEGIQVYGFSTKHSMAVYMKKELQAGTTVYACRIDKTLEMSDQERASIRDEIASLQQRQHELFSKSSGMNPGLSSPGSPRNSYDLQRAHEELSRQRMELNTTIADFNARLRMNVGDIAATEISSASSPADIALDETDGSLKALVDNYGSLHSIGHNGKWLSISTLLDNTRNEPANVKLTLNGSKSSISASCFVNWTLAFAKPDCSIIAATTLELESLDGGSLEDRLAKITPEPLTANSSNSRWQKNLSWSGQPTTLWIKVFQNGQREKPFIDEVIHISYTDRFQAKWGKPPSPLIEIPAPEPHTPPDLAGEPASLDAQGTILDFVAAADGSVLLVQTDKPPYWQALDLKSRRFIKTPWQAGPDTLLAAQAGKIHLLDRNTGVVETWELDGKTRLGLQLLPREGPIVAFAAAMSAADAPLLVVTKNEGFFVDPVNFEILSNGFDMSPCFAIDNNHHSNLPKLIPETIRVRASHDGTVFHVSGKQAQRTDTMSFPVIVDPSGFATSDYTQGAHLALRGRMSSAYFPDHGGTGITLRPDAGSNVFPGVGGSISFISNSSEQNTIGVFRGAPMTLSGTRSVNGPLAHDRGIYFDSSHGVMIIPDENSLNIIPIHLPKQQAAIPRFTFAGETVSIPLPKGKDHKLISSIGGEIKMSDTEALWTAPEPAGKNNTTLSLEWNGELGSAMKTEFKVSMRAQAQQVIVESPDGKTRLPLRRLGIISGSGQIIGFAGCGHVMITRGSGVFDVWSVTEYRKLFSTEKGSQLCIGDADHIYSHDQSGKLKTYDIRTAELLKETTFGKKQNALSGITTGMSSRIPLLAVERDEHQPFLQIIDRKTLSSTLLDFSKEIQNRFFIARFQTNPEGTASWSINNLIIRKGDNITVRTFNTHMHDGIPDASGRFIVSSSGILDLQPKEPVILRFDEMLGDTSYSYLNIDESGKYLMLKSTDSQSNVPVISVREISAPKVEKLRVVFPANAEIHGMRFISGGGKLISSLSSDSQYLGVFELDIPSLLNEFAKP